MKKIVLSTLLLALTLMGQAQNIFQPYSTYTLEQKEDKLSDILYVDSAMMMIFGYENFKWNDPVNPAGNPIYQLHGFKYDADAIIPIWGPVALDLNFIGFNGAFGRYDGEFACQMSWNIGVMPMLGVQFNRFKIHLFGGVKGYLSFLLDGTDSFPLTTLSSKQKSIGRIGFLTAPLGIDLIYKNIGLRVSYEKGITGRLKDKWYEENAMPRELYNPRYDMLSVSLIIFMDL